MIGKIITKIISVFKRGDKMNAALRWEYECDMHRENRFEEIQEMDFSEKLDRVKKDLNDPETIIGYALHNAIKDCDVPADADVIEKLDYLSNDQFKELKEAIDDYIYSFDK